MMGAIGSRTPISVTTPEIVLAYCTWVLRTRRQTHVFPNTWLGSWEGDLWEVSTAGLLTEIELKVSRADFFGDIKKKRAAPNGQSIYKYDVLAAGRRANRFYYLTPKDLVRVDELPTAWAGLIEFKVYDVWGKKEFHFTLVKRASQLTAEHLGSEYLPKLMESTYYRFHYDRILKAHGEKDKMLC